MKRILEVNVDDQGFGGVYSLVRSVILRKPPACRMDIACIMPFSDRGHEEELERCGCRVHFIGIKGKNHVGMRALEQNLYALLSQHSYDYVHIHGDTGYRLYAFGKAAARAGVPNIIFHSHAAGVDGRFRAVKKALHYLYRGRLKALGTRFAACSDLAGKWMYPNVAAEQIVRISNGIDLEKFRYNETVRLEERKKLGWDHALIIGHVGRFSFQKNHEYLIDVFAALRKKIPEARLLLVGSHDGAQELWEDTRRKAEELGLKDDVKFYGTSGHIERLMQAMDVFALPSRFEGLPVVGVEAQAAGLPVVYSNRITREAALTEHAAFIGIGPNDIGQWIQIIKAFAAVPREDCVPRLREEKYDIEDTVKGFFSLYDL